MVAPKYQIFISSTYDDLRDERDQVIKAILEMGHIPVGMEMFSAADEEQWKIIARQIDQSDYYVVIVAHRYGSWDGDVSYTEKEYDYAIQQGVPVIGFVIEDSAAWPNDRAETDNKKRKALAAFKAKVKRKPVGFWSDAKDLYGKVPIALMKQFNSNPRPGWIRATEMVGPEVVTELSRLSSENAQLREQLEKLQQIDTSIYAQGDEIVEIEITFEFPDPSMPSRSVVHSITVKASWDELFLETGKMILKSISERNIRVELGRLLFEKAKEQRPLPDKAKFDMKLEAEFFKIKTQFVALGYIDTQLSTSYLSSITPGRAISQQPHTDTIWVLTSVGKRKLASLLAIKREPANSDE